MQRPTLVRLTPRPVFDADSFIRLAHTGPLPDDALQELAERWPATRALLNAWRVDSGQGKTWLMLWLDQEAEDRVERTWAASPSRGFLTHALAVHCVMAAAAEVVPELAEAGCAPVSGPDPSLSAAARELGLDWPEAGTLCRRYALVTRLPYSGGCDSCALHKDCPRLKTPGTTTSGA